MFQLGSLVVLCGLLIGNSESLLGELGKAVNNLNILNLPSEDVPQNLILDTGSIQQATSWPSAKSNILEALNTVDVGNLKDFTRLNGLSLKLNNLKILDFQAGLSSDGNGIELTVPVAGEASLVLPVIGKAVDISFSLDLINSLSIKTNAQTGLPEVTIGKCSSNTDKISISLLGRRLPIVNKILDDASTLLTSTLSTLLQNFLCPLLQYIFSILNPSVLQSLLSNLLGGQVQLAL
ncbi:BPI fold-containing family A member 2 [Mus caroli]|uniref:BPI fold-containing family A member 2 n=1 Tax=Mus caroli TaxID=10089 RepID=A0A6P5PD07_MUSCR|nr:BPI fold-containing family A member 2 [Mus caroli]